MILIIIMILIIRAAYVAVGTLKNIITRMMMIEHFLMIMIVILKEVTKSYCCLQQEMPAPVTDTFLKMIND